MQFTYFNGYWAIYGHMHWVWNFLDDFVRLWNVHWHFNVFFYMDGYMLDN